MKKIVRFLMLVVALSLCVALLWNCGEMEYNNWDKAESLITETYSPEQIGWIQTKLEAGAISFASIRARFNIQCLRKTHQGYYAVLLQIDGSRVYIFMDDHYKVTRVLVCETFLSRKRFEEMVRADEYMTMTEVCAMDANTLPMPTNVPLRTSHLVKEGVMLVTYTYVIDGQLLDEAVVEKIDFIDNATAAINGDDIGLKRVPYILEIDKSSRSGMEICSDSE